MSEGLLKIPDLSKMKEVDPDEDPLRYYKTPLIGQFYLMRLERAIRLLAGRRYARLLDVGCGSGILLPTLARYSNAVTVIDIHDQMDAVQSLLAREKIHATLMRADVRQMPFSDASFDAVVCVAILDHVSPIEQAAKEITRVLSPGGILILGNVVENKLTNFLFACIGAKTHIHHVSPYTLILPALEKQLVLDAEDRFPKWLPLDLCLYFWRRYKKPNSLC